jgi:hypothetical protein
MRIVLVSYGKRTPPSVQVRAQLTEILERQCCDCPCSAVRAIQTPILQKFGLDDVLTVPPKVEWVIVMLGTTLSFFRQFTKLSHKTFITVIPTQRFVLLTYHTDTHPRQN